jgi:hypothetical protein
MEKQVALLTDLGKLLGIELTFDENNQCFLLLDERVMISIRDLNNHFVLYGMLGEFPEDKSATFWQKLLALNVVLAETGAGSIALEESADVVMLIKAIHTDGLTVAELEKEVSVFVSQVEKLITALTEDDFFLTDPSLFIEYERGV